MTASCLSSGRFFAWGAASSARTLNRPELERTLADQMHLLRVGDNSRYPAFVEWHGRRITIEVRPESGEIAL